MLINLLMKRQVVKIKIINYNLTMHKSESQFRLINTYMDEEVVNPLSYNLVQFQKQEWDNIPMVIHRFCFHLEKQIEALTAHYNARVEGDPDPEARGRLIDSIKASLREQQI